MLQGDDVILEKDVLGHQRVLGAWTFGQAEPFLCVQAERVATFM